MGREEKKQLRRYKKGDTSRKGKKRNKRRSPSPRAKEYPSTNPRKESNKTSAEGGCTDSTKGALFPGGGGEKKVNGGLAPHTFNNFGRGGAGNLPKKEKTQRTKQYTLRRKGVSPS